VELVKRLAQKPPAESQPPTINNIEYKIKSTVEQLSQLTQQTTTANDGNAAIPLSPPPPPPPPQPASTATTVPGMAKRVMDNRRVVNLTRTVSETPITTPSTNELERLPRVRGLTNLGNTCFFNAVMQCLAQTPFLLDVLKELGEPGEQ